MESIYSKFYTGISNMNYNSIPKNLVKSSSLPLMKLSNPKKRFPLKRLFH